MREIRYLDKLIDELARGKAMARNALARFVADDSRSSTAHDYPDEDVHPGLLAH